MRAITDGHDGNNLAIQLVTVVISTDGSFDTRDPDGAGSGRRRLQARPRHPRRQIREKTSIPGPEAPSLRRPMEKSISNPTPKVSAQGIKLTDMTNQYLPVSLRIINSPTVFLNIAVYQPHDDGRKSIG